MKITKIIPEDDWIAVQQLVLTELHGVKLPDNAKVRTNIGRVVLSGLTAKYRPNSYVLFPDYAGFDVPVGGKTFRFIRSGPTLNDVIAVVEGEFNDTDTLDADRPAFDGPIGGLTGGGAIKFAGDSTPNPVVEPAECAAPAGPEASPILADSLADNGHLQIGEE